MSYERWGDYELDMWERTDDVEADFGVFEDMCHEAFAALMNDPATEDSDLGEDIPEYLDWEYIL